MAGKCGLYLIDHSSLQLCSALWAQFLQNRHHEPAPNASGLNTYGAEQHKQVYIYGRLARGPITLGQNYGMYWGVGGWLVMPVLKKLGPKRAAELQARVVNEIKTTFASHITDELSLLEAIDPANIARYFPKKTGEKYLIKPQKGL